MPAHGDGVDQIQSRLRNQIGQRAVVFLGSAHIPNIEAALFIVDELAPNCRNIKFHILGSVCNALPRTADNIKLWGIVDEETKSAIMQSCALAVNPIFSGSGSNVKLADYIGNGLFVLTTEFGKRGYSEELSHHIATASPHSFAAALKKALDNPDIQSKQAREARQEIFQRTLSMPSIAARFVEILRNLEIKKKRVLYIAYRYASPALGGAELYMEKLIKALGYSGQFDVDVVAPKISGIHNYWRFGERYSFDQGLGVPIDIQNIRFAHFHCDQLDQK
jgi:glycosyltransferase involved in cell wall biosynthesis